MIRMAKGGKDTLAAKFCSCINKVSKTLKLRKKARESAAIGICVKSVLQTRGRTLNLLSQNPFNTVHEAENCEEAEKWQIKIG
jgi:hypothetical protein